MWNEIVCKDDLNSFMSLFGGFHDSCLKEIKYVSGAYVNNDLSMHPFNKDRSLKVIFQRQYENPSVIEMEFFGLLKMNLFLEDADFYTCEITSATMILYEDEVIWCDCGGLSENDIKNYEGILICGSRVRWRPVDEYIGQNEVYKSVDFKNSCGLA